MNKKIISAVKYSLFFLIGITLIVLVFKDADPVKMLNDLKQADYRLIFLSFLMGFVAYISRAQRWLIMLDTLGYKVKLINAISSVTITYFTNLALPRAGEVARATSLNQSEGVPVDKLLGTIVIERVIDMLLLLVLMLTTVILRYNDLMNFFSTALSQKESSSPAFNTELLLSFFVIIAILVVISYLLRNRIKETSIYDKIRSFLQGIKEGITTVKHMEKKGEFIFHTLLIWLLYYFMVYVVFFAIPETSHLNLSDGLFIMAVGALGMVAPVPGGLGAYHGAVMIGLTLLGVSKDSALSFAVIVHTTQTLIAIIFGPIAFILTSISKNKREKLLKH